MSCKGNEGMHDAAIICRDCRAALPFEAQAQDACPECGASFVALSEAVLEEGSRAASDYASSIRSAARGLWLSTPPGAAGPRVTVLTYDQFFDAMISIIRNRLPKAWEEGAKRVGVLPEEMTAEERVALQQAIASEVDHIAGFAAFIEEHAKAVGGKWGAVNNRVGMWANRYLDVVNRAMAMAGANKKLRWKRHALRVTKQSCVDCLKLDGRVYRAQTWQKWDVRPQSPYLACGGLKCGCAFEVVGVDVRCTPGRPPKLSGQ